MVPSTGATFTLDETGSALLNGDPMPPGCVIVAGPPASIEELAANCRVGAAERARRRERGKRQREARRRNR